MHSFIHSKISMCTDSSRRDLATFHSPLKGESMILACGLFLSNSDDNKFVQRPCQDVDL